MRRHRVRLPGLTAGEHRLSGPAAHHLARVLRVRPGAGVDAFDGAGLEAAGTVEAVDADAVTLRLEAPRPARTEADRSVVLAVALLKGDKLADVVRMGTELGVVGFEPFVARRCDVRDLSDAKRARLTRVSEEAARQSGRALVPAVAPVVALDALTWTGRAFVASPTADASLDDHDLDDDEPITVITGPEGGFTDAEVEALVARGAHAITLGRRTLRAETAPVAAVAALLVPRAA
jgi:16S rRNA (uracil1498-N3)-methyltransferase